MEKFTRIIHQQTYTQKKESVTEDRKIGIMQSEEQMGKKIIKE